MVSIRLILMFLLALRLLGGDLAMLQLVAWTGMLVTRSTERGVSAAIKSTFDGEEPCLLCQAVKAVQQSDREEQPENPEGLITKLKLKDMLRYEDLVLQCPTDLHHKSPSPDSDSIMRGLSTSDAPPVPPPRQSVA